ncbi:MAG: hypothetical protein V3V20_04380 [Algisphaera sp.]
MVTGSVAGVYHGYFRGTQDIDVVIEPTAQTLAQLLKLFPSDSFYASEEAAMDALRRRSMFNIIELETGWKFDLLIRKNRFFSSKEFERRESRMLGDQKVYITSAEDLLIAKLEWSKAGGSARQLEDAASILRIQKKSLDHGYIQHWVNALNLEEPWQSVCVLGDSGRAS